MENIEKISFENLNFYYEENVSSYKQDKNNSVWIINKYEENLDKSLPINVFIFSSAFYNQTFGHFFFDGFIFMQYFSELKKIIKEKYGYENIKVHLHKNPPRSFKKTFLDLFDIKEDETFYADFPGSFIESTYCINKLPKNNICFYSDIYSCHDQNKNEIEAPKFKSIIYDYKKFVENKLLNFSDKYDQKNIDILLFMRTEKEGLTRETCHQNDRKINYKPLLDYLDKRGRKVTIFNPSDETTDYLYQINLVKSCNYLIVEYGAGFWTNGLFSKNGIVIGNYKQHIKWYHLKNIFEVIEENCNITFLNSTRSVIQINNINCFQEDFEESELNKLNKIL